MYNILSVTSYSGVGKTTLIENIVKILTDRGYKIGRASCRERVCLQV